jgi:hypothetical protein
MPRKVGLSRAKVLDSWSVLAEKAQGNNENIYSAMKRFIEGSKVPEIEMEMVTVLGRPIGFF